MCGVLNFNVAELISGVIRVFFYAIVLKCTAKQVMLLGFGALNCNRIILCELISHSNGTGLFCETTINSVVLLAEGS